MSVKMGSVKPSGVRRPWIGLAVRATIKAPRGGRYPVMGKLVEVNEKGIKRGKIALEGYRRLRKDTNKRERG